jgi:hypothetical protein
MELTEQQRQSVKEWLAAGASLADVQENLKSEFGIALTYMDVRLLVLEIGAAVKDKPDPEEAKPKPPPPPSMDDDDPYADDPYADESFGDETTPDGEQAAKVSLSLDRVMRPGAVISGTVTFSDGAKASWLIDQYGRFGLDPETPGYQPAPADMRAFQLELRAELRRHGYA